MARRRLHPCPSRVGKTVIDTAAASAGRDIDPEHFGLSIGYTDRSPDEQLLAALTGRNPDATRTP